MKYRICSLLLALSLQSTQALELGMNALWFNKQTNSSSSKQQSYFKENVDFTTTDNPWKDVVIEELGQFHCIRLMDHRWRDMEASEKWNDRRQKRDPEQTPDWSRDDADGLAGVAYEWQIQLCNAANSDMWITIPFEAVQPVVNPTLNDFCLRLAILLKTGVDMKEISLTNLGDLSLLTEDDFIAAGGVKTCEPLAANLNLYTEFSNETWLSKFGECITRGESIGTDGFGYHVYAASEIARAFYAVYGQDHPRIRPLLAGQSTNAWHCKQQLIYLRANNPYNIDFFGFATAPYVPINMTGQNATVEDCVNHISDAIEDCWDHRDLLEEHRQLTGHKILLVGYEGGQHIWPADEYQDDRSAMYNFYKDYLQQLDQVMEGVFCHYGYASGSTWGAKDYPGEDLSVAPKARALWEYTRELPPPEPVSNPSPGNNASGISQNPTLSWTAGGGAVTHKIYFGTTPTLGSGELQTEQSGTSFDPGNLTAETTYFWRVDEVNTEGETAGPLWSFTTRMAPASEGIEIYGLTTLLAGSSQSDQATFQLNGISSDHDYLLICAVTESAVVSSLSYGGEALVQLAKRTEETSRITFFGLPTSRSNGEVSIQFSGDVWGSQVFTCFYLKGVHPTSPLRGSDADSHARGSGTGLLNLDDFDVGPQNGDALFVGVYRDARGESISLSPVDYTTFSGSAGATFSAATASDILLPAEALHLQIDMDSASDNRESALGIVLRYLGPDGDRDQDGFSDRLEAFLGTDPDQPGDNAGHLQAGIKDTTPVFLFTRSLDPERPGAQIYWSVDLQTWSPSGSEGTVLEVLPQWERMELELPVESDRAYFKILPLP